MSDERDLFGIDREEVSDVQVIPPLPTMPSKIPGRIPQRPPPIVYPPTAYSVQSKEERPAKKEKKLDTEFLAMKLTAYSRADTAFIQSTRKAYLESLDYEQVLSMFGQDIASNWKIKQESAEKKRKSKEETKYAYLITVNCKLDVEFSELYNRVEDFVNNCTLIRKHSAPVLYCYERRWKNEDPGYHVHILIVNKANKYPSDFKRALADKAGFADICEIKNPRCLNIQNVEYGDPFLARVKYILGQKTAEKGEYVENDRQWRIEAGLMNYYMNRHWEEQYNTGAENNQ